MCLAELPRASPFPHSLFRVLFSPAKTWGTFEPQTLYKPRRCIQSHPGADCPVQVASSCCLCPCRRGTRLPSALWLGADEGPLAGRPQKELGFLVGCPFLAPLLGGSFSLGLLEPAILTKPQNRLGGKIPTAWGIFTRGEKRVLCQDCDGHLTTHGPGLLFLFCFGFLL